MGRGDHTPATAPSAAVMLPSLVAPSEPGEPGSGSTRLALLPARSVRLPPVSSANFPA